MDKATFDQYLELGQMIKRGEIPRAIMQAIIEGKVVVRSAANDKPTVVVGIITVPVLYPSVLVTRAYHRIDPTYLSNDFTNWDFTQHRVEEGQSARTIKVHGKRYEVLTWQPGEGRSTEQVREHFKALNADGNTAAFIAWVMETMPSGYHISIPCDDTLLWREPVSGGLCAPFFFHDIANRMLCLGGVYGGWHDRSVFVAFRELPPE